MFSTSSFSSDHTSSVVVPLFHWLLPSADLDRLLRINHVIRKCAHLFEYFVFGWLLLVAIRGPEHGWKLRWALLALLIAAGYSATDEWHQSFVLGRDSSAWDALLDTTGAGIAIVATWIAFRKEQQFHRDAGGSHAS